MGKGDKDGGDGERGERGVGRRIGKIEKEEKSVLVCLDLRFLTFLGPKIGSGSF